MKTIEVLGLGPTLRYYKPDKNNTTVGVNDIFAFHRVDNLLVLDSKDSFTPERFHIIVNSTPRRFYSSLLEWEIMPFFSHIQKAPKPGDLSYLDTDLLPFHVDSSFSAACLAYKLGAKRIIMHGVDLKDHPDLKHYWNQGIIQDVYMRLWKELYERYVDLFVGSEESPLSEFIPIIIKSK